MPHPTMLILATTRATKPVRDARYAEPRARDMSHRAYRKRLAELQSRASHALQARVRRELRAAPDPTCLR